MKSRLITQLAGLVLAAIVLASCGTQKAPVAEVSAPTAEVSAPAPTKERAPATLPTVGQRTNVDGIALTVNSVGRRDALSKFQEAEPGNEFVVVDVLIENTGSAQTSYNPMYFVVKDGSGVESGSVLNVEQGSLKSGDLPPGDKVKGTVAFQVTKGAAALVMGYLPIEKMGVVPPIRVALD